MVSGVLSKFMSASETQESHSELVTDHRSSHNCSMAPTYFPSCQEEFEMEGLHLHLHFLPKQEWENGEGLKKRNLSILVAPSNVGSVLQCVLSLFFPGSTSYPCPLPQLQYQETHRAG